MADIKFQQISSV